RIASRTGSYFMTMPGPPPYGRSSTVRCRSYANSRGDRCSTASSPRSRARPTTPWRTTGSISSANSETTPKRYTSRLPEAAFPIDDDVPAVDVHPLHDARSERDQPISAAAQNQHVVSAGRQQVIDLTERLAAEIP